MGRTLRRGLGAATLILLLVAPAASAQQYEDESGSLDLETDVIVTLTLSGEGYVGDSVVYITLTSDDGTELELGTIPTDDQGRFFGEITLPGDLEPGTYTIAATGVTGQGATRVLSAVVGVGQELTLSSSAASSTTTTTSVNPTGGRQGNNGTLGVSNVTPLEKELLIRTFISALGGVRDWLDSGSRV